MKSKVPKNLKVAIHLNLATLLVNKFAIAK